jgi:ribosomal protein S18 acetylase RimI-like enzyme
MLSVEYRPAEVYLARIEMHPDYQGRGIGAQFLRQLTGEARQRGQHLVLDVLTVNHRARVFYRRHGFREISGPGDGDSKIRMRSPDPAPGG